MNFQKILAKIPANERAAFFEDAKAALEAEKETAAAAATEGQQQGQAVQPPTPNTQGQIDLDLPTVAGRRDQGDQNVPVFPSSLGSTHSQGGQVYESYEAPPANDMGMGSLAVGSAGGNSQLEMEDGDDNSISNQQKTPRLNEHLNTLSGGVQKKPKKIRRNKISPEVKAEIITRRIRGEKNETIADELKLPKTTLSSIWSRYKQNSSIVAKKRGGPGVTETATLAASHLRNQLELYYDIPVTEARRMLAYVNLFISRTSAYNWLTGIIIGFSILPSIGYDPDYPVPSKEDQAPFREALSNAVYRDGRRALFIGAHKLRFGFRDFGPVVSARQRKPSAIFSGLYGGVFSVVSANGIESFRFAENSRLDPEMNQGFNTFLANHDNVKNKIFIVISHYADTKDDWLKKLTSRGFKGMITPLGMARLNISDVAIHNLGRLVRETHPQTLEAMTNKVTNGRSLYKPEFLTKIGNLFSVLLAGGALPSSEEVYYPHITNEVNDRGKPMTDAEYQSRRANFLKVKKEAFTEPEDVQNGQQTGHVINPGQLYNNSMEESDFESDLDQIELPGDLDQNIQPMTPAQYDMAICGAYPAESTSQPITEENYDDLNKSLTNELIDGLMNE